jgi:hypothetical protein
LASQPLKTRRSEGSVSHHFGFNVLEFAEQVEKAIRFLDGAATGLEEEGIKGHQKRYEELRGDEQ